MNKIEYDIVMAIYYNGLTNQRDLAEKLHVSLGLINKSLKSLILNGFLDENSKITEKTLALIKKKKTKQAIILAAGFGMRLVPINHEIPKGLLEINGEIIIERLINQLHSVGIHMIKVVVGFMKEKYEYLIDKFGVELIVNPKYSEKNNLYSLYLAKNDIHNTYIIPCDIYCKINPFHHFEFYSWYMVSSEKDKASVLKINKKYEFVKTNSSELGNKMIGISYLSDDDYLEFIKKLETLNKDKKYDYSFWEETFIANKKIELKPNIVSPYDFREINTYEDLRNIDSNSNSLNSEAIVIIKKVFNVNDNGITNIQMLKKGMTNRSFIFECNNEKYIMRIPGEGTEKLINRENEAEVYQKIKDKKLCDDVYYINSDNGYKITKLIDKARTCNPHNEKDLILCMKKLRDFHQLNLKVNHEFNLFEMINFYESLWIEKKSVYNDYQETKTNVFSLKKFVEKNIDKKCLTHIDAVPDNFLIYKDEIRLIDWEYAGMQDPHVDIAMFCIYALYDKKEIDRLISIYFENQCKKSIQLKIYAYIAICGLLWSNWCEYKRSLGIEFGEYSLRQYRYAKDYYKIVVKELGSDINE